MSAYVNLTGPMVPTEGVPPVLPPDPTVPRAGWIRRLAMLVLLMSYLLAILFRRGPVAGDGPALPDTTRIEMSPVLDTVRSAAIFLPSWYT